jgi:hypothetical protein
MYVRIRTRSTVPLMSIQRHPLVESSTYGISGVRLGQLTLPRVTGCRFSNTGTSGAANCCRVCRVALPGGGHNGTGVNLGVGQSGTASNGMELRFTISGHRRGVEYDITRTRRNSLWERRAGVWSRLESDPMGTRDDHHDDDECLTPRNNRIFAVDRPGWSTVLPAPDGTLFGGVRSTTHADATDVVLRASFAEWVIARSRPEGIGWTRIEAPRPFVYWHSITWLVRNASSQWVLDAARSRIRLGSLSSRVINSAP